MVDEQVDLLGGVEQDISCLPVGHTHQTVLIHLNRVS